MAGANNPFDTKALREKELFSEKRFAKINSRRIEKLEKLEKELSAIIGFRVTGFGPLDDNEIEMISEYSGLKGGDQDYVRDFLNNSRRRPYALMDPSFQAKCGICRVLRNYCCC